MLHVAIGIPFPWLGRSSRSRTEPRARDTGRLRRTVLYVLVAVLALAGSAVFHLSTALGRAAARDGLVAFLSHGIRGTAHIGEVTTLDFGRLDLTDFRIDAPNGETVITTARMGGELHWGELFSTGTIELTPCYFDRSEMWLRPHGPGGQVSLVHAMEVPEGRWTLPLEMNDIELIDNVMHIELPGKPSVTMRDVHGLADLHVGHEFVWRMDGVRGYTDLEPFEVGFRHMSGRLRSDHAHPLIVRMLLDAEIAEPGVRFDYEVPAIAGREGAPYFELDFVELGVSDDRDDCAEDDLEHCEAARLEEARMRAERDARAGERERASEARAAREREAN